MEILLRKHEEWAGILGTKAQVVVPTFGVIAHGIPMASMHLETDTATEGMQNKLQAQNAVNIPGIVPGLVSTHIQDQDTLFPGGGNGLQDKTMLQMPQIWSCRIPMPGTTTTLQSMCRTSCFKGVPYTREEEMCSLWWKPQYQGPKMQPLEERD